MRNLYDEFDDLPEDEKAESESSLMLGEPHPHYGYTYRSDGMFLVRVSCAGCGKQWDALAIENANSRCPVCRQIQAAVPTTFIYIGESSDEYVSHRVNVSFAVAAAGGLLAWAAILWVVLTAFEGAWRR